MLKTDITLKDSYVLVVFTGVLEFTSLKKRFSELFSMENYWDMNAVWHFDTSAIKLSMEDFVQINEFVTSHYPNEIGREKSGFVFNSFFDKSLGELFVKGLEGVPYEVMIHEDLELAEHWVSQ